jgi:hypothetical protein
VGVERIFSDSLAEHCEKIEVVKRRQKPAVQKLFYLRERTGKSGNKKSKETHRQNLPKNPNRKSSSANRSATIACGAERSHFNYRLTTLKNRFKKTKGERNVNLTLSRCDVPSPFVRRGDVFWRKPKKQVRSKDRAMLL